MRKKPFTFRIALSPRHWGIRAFSFACISISSLMAADIQVDTVNDTGTGSFRRAVTVANANDTIDFQPGLTGQTLTDGQTIAFTVPVTMSDVTMAINLTDPHNYTLPNPLTIDWKGNLTLSGVIANTISGNTSTGSLIKNGTGTLILTNANTFTGGITLNEGTIQVSNNAALGTGILTTDTNVSTIILDDGIKMSNAISLKKSLNVDFGTGTSELSGTITGTSGLNLLGTGTLTLSHANTFSGGVSVANNSTLNVTTDKALGTGTLSNTGQLTLDLSSGINVSNAISLGNSLFANVASDTATLSGNITGANQLTKTGSGTLILLGTNTYSSGTFINSGTLQGNSNSLQGDIDISNGTSLVFNQTGDGTYSGNITGSGELTKLGEGLLTFNGTSAASTTTFVKAGELRVTGNMLGPVTVSDTAATLSGTVGVGSVTNGGNVQPGTTSIGILNVNGDYTQHSTGTTTIRIDSLGVTPGTNNDNLNVTGQANLNGSLNVTPIDAGPFSPLSEYTMLSAAGGVSGKFTQYSSSNPDYGVVLTYGANGVSFHLQPTTNLVLAANTPNQFAVATALENIKTTSTGSLYAMINTLGIQSVDQQRQSLTQMSGAMFGDLQNVGIEVADQFQLRVTTRLVSNSQFLLAPSELQYEDEVIRGQSPVNQRPLKTTNQALKGWALGYGNQGNIRPDGNGLGMDFNHAGGIYGYDWGDYDSELIGLTISNSYAWFHDGFGASGQLQAYQFGAYAMEYSDTSYSLATINYGYNIYDTNRTVTVAENSQSLQADFTGNQIGANAETGLKLNLELFQVQPFIGLQYLYLCQQGFEESGGAAALTVARSRANSLRANIGARLIVDTFTGPLGVTWTPYSHARFVSDLLNNDRYVSATFNGAPVGGAFRSQGTSIGQNFGIIGEGIEVRLNETWSLFGSADWMFGDRYSSVTGSFGAVSLW